MVDIDPLKQPNQQNGSSEWIHLGHYNVRELKSQDNVDDLEPETETNGPGMSRPNVSWAPNLHHCHGEESEEVKENLREEVMRPVEFLEMLGLPTLVNVNQS